jgi:hypothetical protein
VVIVCQSDEISGDKVDGACSAYKMEKCMRSIDGKPRKKGMGKLY